MREYLNSKQAIGWVASLALLSSLIISLLYGFGIAQAATVKQVSTGAETACAVVDGKVKCWGEGGSGQLGNRSTSSSSSPVDVYAVKNPEPIRPNPCGGWFQPSCTPVAQPSSPLGDKTVSKVSVGKNHACAIASAKLYCWGDNSRGQLGDRSNTSSSMPVVVDTQAQDVTPAPVKPNPCGGWFQPSCTPVAQPTKPKSAIGGKEIVDVSTGEYFTCALASDGTVACWGEGDNGRLGVNATTDVNYPKAIYAASGSAFYNKKGIKLSKSSESTMCVIAVAAGAEQSTSGQAYCWGQGINGGQVKPANSSATTTCGKDSPTSSPNTSTKTTIYTSAKPVAIPDASLTAVDGQDYMTGLGADGKAYYWGMYGHQESVTYTNVRTCKVNPCTGKVTIQRENEPKVLLAANGSPPKANGGLNKGKPNASNGFSENGHPGMATYTRYDGNKDTSNSCTVLSTHYGFVKSTNYEYVGKTSATTPANWPQSQSGIRLLSGNVNDGLFCAVTSSNTQCDAHGTDILSGQTGSGYAQQCTIQYANGLFGRYETGRSCSPDPTGPQSVVTSGLLANKQITQMSTGSSGYSCVVAGGALGCWGVNTKGQLGVGDRSSKNVPTEVRF